jgi:hypothetical protein
MAPNLKGYISALAQEVLPAFRRGVIAVTALAASCVERFHH